MKYQFKWSQPKFVLIKHSVKDTENGKTNPILHGNGCNHPPIVSLGKFTSFNYVMHLVAIERNQLEMDGTCWLHKSPVHTPPFCSCWWQIMCLLQRLKTKMPVFFFLILKQTSLIIRTTVKYTYAGIVSFLQRI